VDIGEILGRLDTPTLKDFEGKWLVEDQGFYEINKELQ
jgi:hypothetical protein